MNEIQRVQLGNAEPIEEASYKNVIHEIHDMEWESLDKESFLRAAHAYYYFSVQFRENLLVARSLFPQDEKLQQLESGECDTSNLSPWPGVAAADEKMNHDEFMRRLLLLSPLPEATLREFHSVGEAYLAAARGTEPIVRALSISSYEDGGLETVFRAMLRAPDYDNPALGAFRHFLAEHIRFDSDPEEGHGALSRHLRPDDRILPLWEGFRNILIGFVPRLGE